MVILPWKKWRTHKNSGISLLIQKFIHCYTFRVVVGRKNQSIKTEPPALSGLRKNMLWGENKSRHRPWIFFFVLCCGFNELVCWFRLHSNAFCVRPLFGAHHKMGLTLHLSDWCSLPSLFCSQVTFKPESFPHFCLVLHRHRRFRTSVFFFLVLFNYRSHWRTTAMSTLVRLTQFSLLPHRLSLSLSLSLSIYLSIYLSLCFFLFFLLSLTPSPEMFFITRTYHTTLHPQVSGILLSTQF